MNFFKDFDIRNWKYRGRELANPFVILYKVTLFPLYKLSLIITCLLALVVFDKHTAYEIWWAGS